MVRSLRLALATSLTLLPTTAGAGEDDPAVVVVRMCDAFEAECWREAEKRVEAELLAAGFAVATRSGEAGEEGARREELDAAARHHGAVAALRIVRAAQGGGVSLWIVDRVTGKTSYREVAAADLEGPEAAELVALRTVELLHASFLELEAPHEPRGDAPPTPAVEQFVERRGAPGAPLFLARVGFLVAGAPGGLGAVAGPTLGMSWGFHEYLRLDTDLWGTAVHARVSGEAGTARAGLAAGQLHLMVRPVPGGRVSPAFGVGGGFLLGWAWGRAAPGFRSASEAVVVGLPSASVQLAVRLTRRLRLFGGAKVGVAIPEVEVRLGGAAAGRTGRPLVDGALGLEWAFEPGEEK